MRRLACSLCVILSLSLGAEAAGADAPRDPAAAEALFEKGREAAQARRFDEACQAFTESQRLDPAGGTLMNLADCEENLGKLASAWQHWKEAADTLPRGDDRIAYSRDRAAKLQPRVPYLTVKMGESLPGTQVFRDGVELKEPSLGLPLPLNPGEHKVEVKAPGREAATFTVNLREGGKETLEVSPGPAEGSSTPPQPGGGGSGKTLAYVAGGIGLVGVGAGIVTGFMVNSKRDTVESECVQTICSQSGYDAAQSGKTLLTINTVSWIVGAVGLGAGTVLFFTSGDDEQPSTSVQAGYLPGGGGVSLRRTF